MIEKDIYKTLSDLISDSYDWLSTEENKDKAIQYVLGLNDMARCIAEKLKEEDK